MPTRRLTLDRFEGRDKQIAVTTDDRDRDVLLPRGVLPEGTHGGEVLEFRLSSPTGPDPGGGAAIDLNAATAEQLAALPGIGPVRAARIIAGRPYRRADELARVAGIGAATLGRLRPLLGFGADVEAKDAESRTTPVVVAKWRGEQPHEAVQLEAPGGVAFDLPADFLPADVKPDDVLDLTLRRDREASRRNAERSRALIEELKGRDPGGDVTL